MSKAKTANDIGCPCYKVRISIPSIQIHTISRTEPRVLLGDNGHVTGIEWDPILNTEHGDTIGFIRWDLVTAIAWRHTSDVTQDNIHKWEKL